MAETISQIRIDEDLEIGSPGQPADGGPSDSDNVPNAAGADAGVYTITVTETTPGDPVSVSESLTGESAPVVGGLDTDAATTGPLLAAAINANPVLRGLGVASAVGAVVTFTANTPDIPLEFSVVGGSVATSTAPAEAANFPFGVPVYLDADGNAIQAYPGNGIDVDLYGVSERSLYQEAATPFNSDVSVDGRTDVRVMRTGRIYVEGGASASKGDSVFVGTATAGSTVAGQFYTADDGANREELSKSLASWYGPHTLELKLGL